MFIFLDTETTGTKAVFSVEHTDGEPLEYENIELPDVPLMKRAEESSSVWKVKSSLRREAVIQFRRFIQ
jgi:DNA polymerase III epsilon subunit-like protein